MGSIRVEGLGKAYKQYPTRWSRLGEWVLPSRGPRHSLHWVLSDINFQVERGEAVGVIGINGAGKSTLLKIITGTTQPTTGNVHITGRVAALLELGMGFHPEFTGRQNVFMAGQLLGMSVEEIAALMPEIETFAEIGDYIDQPVRVYSSGMQVRLAFSVATARRPDVLIVDEALSVGDAYFQHKSFDRIRQFRGEGTTLLIVSHDKQAIQSICDRAILLNSGRLAMEGVPDEVMDYYSALLAERQKNHTVMQQLAVEGKKQTISGTFEATTTGIRLLNDCGQQVEHLEVGTNVSLEIIVHVRKPLPRLVLGFLIRDRLGNPIYGTNTHHTGQAIISPKPGDQYRYVFCFPMNLGVGSYSISTAVVSSDTRYENNYECRDLALVFEVVEPGARQFSGVCWLNAQVSVSKI